MSVQPSTIVANTLKRLGITAAGETPSAENAADGFARLNVFVDGLATQRLTMNGIQKFSLTVIAGHNPYTVGIGGDFNQVRPTVIDDLTVTLAGSTPTDIPVGMLDQDQYALLAAKTVQAQIPTNWYYNATYDIATPLGAVYFWPIPNSATLTINLWVPVAITQFATPATTYTLLPGWQEMLETNLAVDWASDLGVEVPPYVAQRAAGSMQFVKGINTEPGLLGVDHGLLKSGGQQGFGNWLTGP